MKSNALSLHLTFNFHCSVSEPFNKTRDLAMWLWNTHNKVNKRLREKENELKTFDPRFPKILWPPKQLCPSCYKSSNENNDLENIIWDEDEVFKFLVNYYGGTIATLQQESSLSSSEAGLSPTYDITPSNAVVVPVGAALAIAVVSCAFGALACFWRTQQKTRKYSLTTLYLRYN